MLKKLLQLLNDVWTALLGPHETQCVDCALLFHPGLVESGRCPTCRSYR
jgi:predicted Zn-ribbon and HTH transcriptional regulator